MVTLTAAADSWKSWLDDAPLPETFNSATGGLQDFITALSRALLDARAERDRAIEAVRQMHHAVCGETGFAAAVRADSGRAYPWPALDLAEEIALEVMRKDMGNV